MTVLVQTKVGGRPRTKGSLRVTCRRNRAHDLRYEEDITESKPWRAKMARALREAQLAQHGKLLSWPGPVEVRLVFFFPREQSVAGGNWPTHDTVWPTAITLGDVDKLTRNALDAMLTPSKREGMELCSGLLADDSQVVLLTVGKFWVAEDFEPGVQILVMSLGEDDNPVDIVEAEFGAWDGLTA